MEVGLVIAGLAVASAVSLLSLARFAPRALPPTAGTVLTGTTPGGLPWTLDPDRSHPDRTRWIWRSGAPADEPSAGWRGDPADWHRAVFEATGRQGDPPRGSRDHNGCTLAGKPFQDGMILEHAPAGLVAFGWDGSGWATADFTPGESPEPLVAFAARLSDQLHAPVSAR